MNVCIQVSTAGRQESPSLEIHGTGRPVVWLSDLFPKTVPARSTTSRFSAQEEWRDNEGPTVLIFELETVRDNARALRAGKALSPRSNRRSCHVQRRDSSPERALES